MDAHRLSWRAYAESMPFPCDTVTSGLYAARHNPAVYYTALRAACAHDDVAMGPIGSGALHRALYGGTLANLVFVTPNICDDAHSCPVLVGDQWLERFLAGVFASPTYRLGHTVVFVTWDEGNLDNRVATIVAAPSVPGGTRSGVAFDHYSLLKTAEQLLGLPALIERGKGEVDGGGLPPLRWLVALVGIARRSLRCGRAVRDGAGAPMRRLAGHGGLLAVVAVVAAACSSTPALPTTTHPKAVKRHHPTVMKDLTFPSSYGVESSWVVAENKRPGTNAWRITKGASPDIAGYAATTYAAEGSKVNLYVTTPAARFQVQAYRIGYYQGKGARLVWQSGLIAGHQQPACL